MSITVFPRLCFNDTFSNAEGSFSKGKTHSTCGRTYNQMNKNSKFLTVVIKSSNTFIDTILHTLTPKWHPVIPLLSQPIFIMVLTYLNYKQIAINVI